MGAFFVGQRVRIVNNGGVHGSENLAAIGREVRIIARSDTSHWDWDVADVTGEVWEAVESCLEPILPEGHRPAELTVEELLPWLRAPVTP